ncbi:MAG: hypothetical protein ACRDUY_06485 [Nitriliruptorales bacterium]
MIARARQHAVPATATLVRILAPDDRWPGRLPIVPAGHLVSITVTSAAMASRWPELEERGYRFAGEVPAPLLVRGAEVRDVADIVVGEPLVAQEPAWWRALLREARHTFPLAFGPVLTVFDEVLAKHGSVWSLLHVR